MHKEEGEMGEEGRSLGHKLNIIDGITDGIIPSVTLSVKYHVTIRFVFFESHYNTLCISLGIYRENLSVDIFTDIFYRGGL
jgi:hypothetical protein